MDKHFYAQYKHFILNDNERSFFTRLSHIDLVRHARVMTSILSYLFRAVIKISVKRLKLEIVEQCIFYSWHVSIGGQIEQLHRRTS